MVDFEQQEHIIDSLLSEFKAQRDEIKKMIEELQEARTNINNIFPEKLDQRYRYYFEEKVKAVTNLFSVLLDMRKEINKSLKDEIELRRKIKGPGEIDLEDILDVRKIARSVEHFNDEVKKIKEGIQGETDE